MKWLSLVALVVGVATIAGFAWSVDRSAIAAAVLASAPGIAAICVCRLISLAADAVAWSVLIPREARPGFGSLMNFRWMSKSINVLLPAMQVGGDLVRLGMLRRTGAAAEAAGASVLVDVTLGFVAQVAFTLLGAVALASVGSQATLTAPLVVGVLFGTAFAISFYLVQRLGALRLFARSLRRLSATTRYAAAADRVANGIESIDRASVILYRSGTAVVLSTLWHLVAWLLRTADTVIALYFMGFEIGLREAVIIESLSLAIRSAAFMIPGGLGAQEGAILFLGGAFGLTPEIALALAVVKRLQEIIVFGPGLAAWWLFEHRATGHRSQKPVVADPARPDSSVTPRSPTPPQ